MRKQVHRTVLVMGGVRLPMDTDAMPDEAQVFAHFGLRGTPKVYNIERSVETVEVRETNGQLLETWLKAAGCKIAVMDADGNHVGFLSDPGVSFDKWLIERGS